MKKKIGNLAVDDFLRRHWQKRPLLVRSAIPGFRGVLDLAHLRALALRDDVESRIVQRKGKRWETLHGPFQHIASKGKDWTLLVSGVNLHVPAADELLRRFSFIPQARLDDVMVSYATPGGGVGTGAPIRSSTIHAPRITGEVRSATDVTVRMLP